MAKELLETTAETAGTGKDRERLTRQRILRAALHMVDRDGLEELSMRRLATELGVSAMSLYNHVPNKEALLEGMTEILMTEIDLDAVRAEDWAEGLKAGLRSFRKVLLDHPNALHLIETKPVVTPEAFRPIEISLAILMDAGFSEEDAVSAHWAIVGYTIGHVSFQIHSPMHDPDRAEEQMMLRRQNLSEEEFPCLFAALPHAIGSDFNAAFEFGLDTLMTGLKAKLAG